MGKKLQICFWLVIAVVVFVALGGVVYQLARATNEGSVHPEVTFEIENVGTIKMELYPEYAPNTVKNIIRLVENGFYTNKVVYGKDEICLYVGRSEDANVPDIKASYMIDGIAADSEEDYNYSISGEFLANGFEQNTLNHEKGTVTLLRNDYGTGLTNESYNSGNTQIAVMMNDDSAKLNGSYAAFAKITEGLDLLEKVYNEGEILSKEDEASDQVQDEAIERFATYPVIKSATVDTKGIDFGDPVIQEIFDYSEYMYQIMQQYYGQ